ncbi:MAG TPA: lipopolysaccharide biosynthesis protein [Bryobacteraceae bacterium]|jgi:O-antigen/teichoic acid export membrane protein
MSTSELPVDVHAADGSANAQPAPVSSLAGLAPAAAGLSIQSNFAWVLTGNVVYAACQWGMIVALAKLGNSFMVGQFSLGLAIVTPILMFANFDLRAVQATDAGRDFRFAQYLRLRLVTTLCGLALIGCVVWFGKYEKQTALVILAVALAKAVETLSDIHYGLFQLNDRLDQTGRSMMLRGVASVAALWVGLRLTHELLWACICLAAAWLGTLVLFDVRRGRRLVARTETSSPRRRRNGFKREWRLLRLALPLGAVATIVSINLHMPRYFIHAHMGDHQLGIYSAIAYATVAMTLVSDSLSHSTIPRLSRLYAATRIREFRALLLRLLALASGAGLLGVALVDVFGARILTLVYSREYALNPEVFVLLTAAAAVQCAGSMLTSGITSTRQFRIQVPLFIAMAGSTALACAWWIPERGLIGAALAVLAGAIVRLILAAWIITFLLRRLPGAGQARPTAWIPAL